MHSTLLLNADFTPVTLLPIKTIAWQDAIGFMWTDTAQVLHSYEDWVVSSPSVAVNVPAVMVLRDQVHPRRFGTFTGGSPRHLVFLRDNFVCQYCGEQFSSRALTLDHVVPRVYGGPSRWENLTSACEPCNGSRGHDIRIQPRTRPFRPTFNQLVSNLRKLPLTIPHESWNLYLQWPEQNIRVISPRGKIMQDNFDFVSTLSVG